MNQRCLNLVIAGHVDHGKSTLIGRLLFDTNSLSNEALLDIKKTSKALGKEIEFAFLMDCFSEERGESFTLDTTQAFLKTKKRNYTIIDVPGHREFFKNMITGAAQAEAAILVVDIKEGIKEQTKRHICFLNLLGLKQIIIVVNKMDLVGYQEAGFKKIKKELSKFLFSIGAKPLYCIPVSAKDGENITKKSKEMKWYQGPTILGAMEKLRGKKNLSLMPFRFPVQDVYQIEGKKTIVGKIESGQVSSGDNLVIFPIKKRTNLKSIEVFNKGKTKAEAEESIGLVLDGYAEIKRGQVICQNDRENLPKVTKSFLAEILWMSNKEYFNNRVLILKCATQRVEGFIEKIFKKFNSSTLELINEIGEIKETELAEVKIKTMEPIVIDEFDKIPATGRFVIEEGGEMVAIGIIKDVK